MKGACVIRAFSLVGLVGFIFALAAPWYMQISKVDENDETLVIQTNQQFWYLTRFESCTGECDTTFTTNFWTFGSHSKVRIVFGVTWTFTLLATIANIFVTLSGRPMGSLVAMFFGFIALLVFLAVTPAIRNNTEFCAYGPCDSFTGYRDDETSSTYWGPSFGWYACVLAMIWMFVVGIVGTMCWIRTCLCHRKKRRSKKDRKARAPLLEDKGGWAKYSEIKKNEMKEVV